MPSKQMCCYIYTLQVLQALSPAFNSPMICLTDDIFNSLTKYQQCQNCVESPSKLADATTASISATSFTRLKLLDLSQLPSKIENQRNVL